MQIENSKMIYRGSGELARVYRGQTIVWEPKKSFEGDYLTFEMISGGTIVYNNYKSDGILYYRKNGTEWTEFVTENGSGTTTVYDGDIIEFKGQTNDRFGELYSVNGRYNIYGNIMSLIYGDNFQGQKILTKDMMFYHTFSNEISNSYPGAVNAENLILPATTLTSGCYSALFFKNRYLITPPSLIDTALKSNCYDNMFANCASLRSVPKMSIAPQYESCHRMFANCTSLTDASSIIIKSSINIGACQSMFIGCTALVNGPILKASTLYNASYRYMFSGCASLQRVACLATNISEDECLTNWMKGVPSGGVFTKSPNMDAWPTGISGIPDGWTVVDG